MKKQNQGKKTQLRREKHKCLGLAKMEVFHEDAVSEHTVGNMEHICGKCALMFWDEQHKNINKISKDVSYLLCCSYGSVQIPPVSEPPGLLRTLLSGNYSTYCHLMQNIWTYSSVFAFASMTLTGHEFAFWGKGPYCFRINGQVYHTNSQLLLEPGFAPNFHSYICMMELQN